MLNIMTNELVLLGIRGLQKTVINDWIGPAFFIILAAVAIMLVVGRKLREGLILGVVAVLVGIYVFAGESLFGQSGNLTGAGQKIADKVNTVNTVDYQGII